MDDIKYCKDCKHVDKSTIMLGEQRIECLREPKIAHEDISPVTGEKVTRYTGGPQKCLYERNLGGCKNACYFEPDDSDEFTFLGQIAQWLNDGHTIMLGSPWYESITARIEKFRNKKS
jgi:hypothetical protein